MCGIVGTIGYRPSEETRDRALATLAARGPDGIGSWADGDAMWFGHRRLAIQDLSQAGAQPMALVGRDDLVITYNGEIYNYAALRRKLEGAGCSIRSTCDTELLLHAYTVWGESMFDHLEGMFAFVIWDGRQAKAILARDPVGQKPLYYRRTRSSLSFASSSATLRALEPAINRLSATALGYVLTLGYVPAPHSVWEDVEMLSAGHVAVWSRQDGSWRMRPYWSPPDRVEGRQDAEGFRSLFSTVCEEHLIADVPVGLLLSGGLDSAAVALALRNSGGTRPQTVTLDFVGSENSEAPIAAQTARQLDLDNQLVPLKPEGVDALRRAVAAAAPEPQGYSAVLTWYLASEAVARRFKVVLTGDGGDELFGGYSWYHDLERPFAARVISYLVRRRPLRENASASERVGAMTAFGRRSLLHRHATRLFPRFLPEEAEQLLAPMGGRFDEETMLAPLERHFLPELPVQNALQRVDLMSFCSGSILAKTDSMSMAHSLEVRAPFLDRRLIDWALSRSTPDQRRGAEKQVVRRYLGKGVPEAVHTHPKQGFSMRGMETYDFTGLQKEIAASRLVTDGILRSDFERYVAPGTPYRDARYWTIAAVASWYDSHVSGPH